MFPGLLLSRSYAKTESDGLDSRRYNPRLLHWGCVRFLACRIASASQASILLHATLCEVYPRSAAPLPPVASITDAALSTRGAPSTTILQSRHSRRSLQHSGTGRCRVGAVDPAVRSDRSSLDVGRPFVPLKRLVVDRPWRRESAGRRL